MALATLASPASAWALARAAVDARNWLANASAFFAIDASACGLAAATLNDAALCSIASIACALIATFIAAEFLAKAANAADLAAKPVKACASADIRDIAALSFASAWNDAAADFICGMVACAAACWNAALLFANCANAEAFWAIAAIACG